MKHVMRFLLICFLVFPTKGMSQEITYNLQKLLTDAVTNNAEIKKAALVKSESKYKTKEAIAHGLPQVDGGINYTRMGIPGINLPAGFASSLPQDLLPLLGSLEGVDALHILSTGVTVSQLVYSQPYLTGIQQARKAGEIREVMYTKTKDEVIYDITSTYYQIINNYLDLKILNENIDNLESLNKILKLQYENDFVKKTDVSRVKVQVANLKTKREMLINAIDIREQILKIHCGIPVETKMVLDTLGAEVENVVEPSIEQFSLERLYDFQLMQKQKDLAKLKIKSDQAAYYPNLAVFGQFNYSSYTTKFTLDNLSNANTIGLKATIPIFSSGLRRDKLMQSKLQLQELNEDIESNNQQLGVAYRNSMNTLLSAWKGLNNQQENKALAQDVYKQIKLRFDEGLASLTDLLSVETSLLEAESLYNQQLLKYRIAGLDLKKSTGELQSIINTK